MYQTTTPTENGWYWVEYGGWSMAYLNAESDHSRNRRFASGRPVGVLAPAKDRRREPDRRERNEVSE